MIHWTSSQALKEKPITALVIASVMITAIYVGIGYLA